MLAVLSAEYIGCRNSGWVIRRFFDRNLNVTVVTVNQPAFGIIRHKRKLQPRNRIRYYGGPQYRIDIRNSSRVVRRFASKSIAEHEIQDRYIKFKLQHSSVIQSIHQQIAKVFPFCNTCIN